MPKSFNHILILVFLISFYPISIAQTGVTLSLDRSEVNVNEGDQIEFRIKADSLFQGGFSLVLFADQSTSATINQDYKIISSDTILFAGRKAETKIVRLKINKDKIIESDEMIIIDLIPSNPEIGFSDKQSQIRINIKDNQKLKISVSNASVEQGGVMKILVKSNLEVPGGFVVNLHPSVYEKNTSTNQNVISDENSLEKVIDTSFKSIRFNGDKDESYEVELKSKLSYADKIKRFRESKTFKINYEIIPNGTELNESKYEKNGSTQAVVFNSFCRDCVPSKFLDTITQFRIDFVGNGNIQSSFAKGDAIPANTGLGVRLIKHFNTSRDQTFLGFYRVDLSAKIGVASTVDSLTINRDSLGNVQNVNDFGNSILAPLNAGQVVNLEMKLYNRSPWLGLISGLDLNFVSSNRDWFDPDSNVLTQANTNSFRATIFHDLVGYKYRENFAAILKIGYIYNSLRADVGINESLRQEVLGSTANEFAGWTMGVELRLKNISAEFTYYNLTQRKDRNNRIEIPGLTSARVLTTISFEGGFSAILSK